MTNITSIDYLIHPWWAAIFEETPYWDHAKGEFIPTGLSRIKEGTTHKDYLDLTLYQWQKRFKEASEKNHLVALVRGHGRDIHIRHEGKLLKTGKELLGRRFIVHDHGEEWNQFYSRIAKPMRSFWRRRLPQKVNIFAYGEKSTDCVLLYSGDLINYLEDRGVDCEISILQELCSDVSDGKAEAYKRFLGLDS
ncbi:hypothetical protein HYX12_01950 [Candidatus Woesearchaeota archaeon]|nr:hypothetical protein [Candidatus Woesearchaeota archaeon]